MQTYPTGYAESHRIAEQIFREILPRHGMAVREEQIALCHEVLDTLYNKEISLCEAGVGTGKTLAYLVGCILWQMHTISTQRYRMRCNSYINPSLSRQHVKPSWLWKIISKRSQAWIRMDSIWRQEHFLLK